MITDKREWYIGILVVVLLLAGCSAVFPAEDDETDRDPYTVEDGINSSDDTDSEPAYLAPGLTTEGVQSKPTLLNHHFAVLEAKSGNGTYVAVENISQSINGTLARDGYIRSVTQYPERWHEISHTTYEQNATKSTTREMWAESQQRLIRETSSNGSVEYRNMSLRTQPGHPPSPHHQLDRAISVVGVQNPNVTVDEQRRNETLWYIVTGTVEQETVEQVALTDTYTLHVREDGFIEQVSEKRGIDSANTDSEHYEHTLTYEFHPDTPLKQPDWYDDALEAMADDNE